MDINIDLTASPIEAAEISVTEDALDFAVRFGGELAIVLSFEQLNALHHAVAGWLGDD